MNKVVISVILLSWRQLCWHLIYCSVKAAQNRTPMRYRIIYGKKYIWKIIRKNNFQENMHATMHLYYTIAKYYFTRILLLLLSVADICYSWYVYKCCNFLLVLVSAVSHLVVSICNIILLLLKPNREKYVLLYFFLLDLFMFFFSYLFLDLTLL